MKKLISLLSILLISTSIVLAAGPKMTFVKNKTSHDFGKVKKGTPTTYEFEFKNTGDKPLVITNASSTCGCTVPEWPKAPIAPGKSEKIKVVYDSTRLGQINKTVKVTTNAGDYELTITGEVN